MSDTTLGQAAPDTNGSNGSNGNGRLSLGTEAARNLATTTKTAPQMQNISSRWLLKALPWAQVTGGTYRVNRRLTYTVGDGRVALIATGADIRVVPGELCELAPLRGFDDAAVLDALAERFTRRDVEPGEVLAEQGGAADTVVIVAHGRMRKVTSGNYGEDAVIDVLANGEFFGHQEVVEADARWAYTVRADTAGIVLELPRAAFDEVADRSDTLRAHLDQYRASPGPAHNRYGEAAVDLSSGHEGEPIVAGTFVDYEAAPREYDLSVAQTVLRVHSRVADLYNEPMNQVEQQLRLTVEALRERQEYEMVNNRDFGLLHNADFGQRIRTRSGPPTPDDLDELLSRRTKPELFLAHPRAIAAFGRECTRRGVYPDSVDIGGHKVPAWRGLPLFPCNKIPISPQRTTSIMVLRTGENDRGVVGLHQTGIPDEYEPSLSVRFMGINERAIISYLVSAYFSVAILVPDALGVLEDVEIGHFAD